MKAAWPRRDGAHGGALEDGARFDPGAGVVPIRQTRVRIPPPPMEARLAAVSGHTIKWRTNADGVVRCPEDVEVTPPKAAFAAS